MDIRYFIGIDVSKSTLDWAVFDGRTIVSQSQSPNSESGIKATVKLIRGLPGFTTNSSGLATFDWRQILGTFGKKSKSIHEQKTCI